MSEPRRIPIRLAPVPGEGADSWLIAYAHLLGAPVGDIVMQAGLDRKSLFVTMGRLASGGCPSELAALETATSLTPGTFATLTRALRTYDGAAMALPSQLLGSFARVMPWSRYCPSCLAENGGRWPASWRIGWNLVCPTHGRYLACACPACGALARSQFLGINALPTGPRACGASVYVAGGGNRKRCKADLTETQTDAAPEELIRVTALLLDRFEQAQSDEAHEGLLADVTDYIALARTQAQDLSIQPGRWLLERTDVAAEIFSVAASAFLDTTGDAFHKLAEPRESPNGTRALPVGWNLASSRLIAAALPLRRDSMRATDRLRWANVTDGSRPSADTARADAMLRRLPTSLWPGWTLRLLPTDFESQSTLFRATTAVALALPGSGLTINELAESAPTGTVRPTDLTRILLRLSQHPSGSAILRCLGDLARGLDANPAPIDYSRRRGLPTGDELLDEEHWHEYCGQAGVPPGDTRKFALARLWLWELLTGGSYRQAPPDLTIPTTEFATAFFTFTRRLTSTLHDALSGHAAGVLGAHGIIDEPMEWEPSLEFIDTGSLSGLDVRAVNFGAIREELQSGGSIRAIAGRTGMTTEHMRLIARRREVAAERVPLLRVAKYIPEPHLREALVGKSMTTREAAAELGVNRKTISAHAHARGVELSQPGRRPKWQVDYEWLRREYVERLRTLPDLAAEIGCSPVTLARIAKESGVVLRRRGGGSHAIKAASSPGFPPLLAAVTRRTGALKRARSFVAIANARSVNAAARQIGVAQSDLAGLLLRMERAAGGPLVVRPTGARPHVLTPLGRRLLAQIREHLPECILDEPGREPLRSAQLSFRGQGRIDKLLVLASASTLQEAAERLATTPKVVRKSIATLEEVLGRELVIDKRPRAPVKFTKFGRLLIEQALEEAA